MRYDLKVPFAEKDAAKALGARWDAANKLWYVQDKADMAPFAKWSPTLRNASSPAAPQKSKAPAAKAQNAGGGGFKVGSQYRELPRVCDCLPWDVCDKCRASALSA